MRRAIAAIVGTGLLVLALVLAWRWLAPPGAPPPPEPPPPPAALGKLTRGVNLSNWLQHGRVIEPQRYVPDGDDFRRIRALGLDHVRLPVDPAALLDERGLPDPEALAQLRAAIEAAQREDLLVVLVVQLPDEAKARIATREAGRAALAGTWRWLAAALRDIPPTHLAFEPLNETGIEDPGASRGLMAYLAGELRKAAPEHTLVVSGHRYSGVDELEALSPLADRNVVYSFHFYEPHNFTHQGADWGDPKWRALRKLPYPSSPESVAALLKAPGLGELAPEARELMVWHGEERWNRQRIRQRLARAAAWAERHDRPVWCGEFGVLKTQAGAGDRAAWLNDVRVTLEQHGIGWTHWDYAGPFGIVEGPRGERVEDRRAVEALGLGQE
jgi:endoglucanase